MLAGKHVIIRPRPALQPNMIRAGRPGATVVPVFLQGLGHGGRGGLKEGRDAAHFAKGRGDAAGRQQRVNVIVIDEANEIGSGNEPDEMMAVMARAVCGLDLGVGGKGITPVTACKDVATSPAFQEVAIELEGIRMHPVHLPPVPGADRQEGRGPQVQQASNAYRLFLPETARQLLDRFGKVPPPACGSRTGPDGLERGNRRLQEDPAFDERTQLDVGDSPLGQALVSMAKGLMRHQSDNPALLIILKKKLRCAFTRKLSPKGTG